MEYKTLHKKGATLSTIELEKYLEKLASDQILTNQSAKNTYPIPSMKENFEIIQEVYGLLNEHIQLGIPIHPAGEWLLDNFYIIEEVYKTSLKELTKKKYTSFPGIANGQEQGFARIYVLATEIVSYSDNKIDSENLEAAIQAYQRKKNLTMEEIWNISTFIQIALIQNIAEICQKIYYSQMQKYRVENILERLVENKENVKYKNIGEYKNRVKGYGEMKYPFIEYMSHRLREYGKVGYSYHEVLEEEVKKMGTTIEEVIRKEHFDIAMKKVSIANCILSMKALQRLDFSKIFEKLNEVEEILKQDPAQVYAKMDYKTKIYYRNTIKELSKKTRVSEIYIAQKILEKAQKVEDTHTKKAHVGYYLLEEGKYEILEELLGKRKKTIEKEKLYITSIVIIATFIDIGMSVYLQKQFSNIIISIMSFIILWIPLQEIAKSIIQFILGKLVKPKLIPKLEIKEVPEELTTCIVIPTIVTSKEKVKEMMKKLEIYYLANQSKNLYFTLLGDCSSGKNEVEKFDEEVRKEGIEQTNRLNQKYKAPIFHFVYRKRLWNEQEECYLGWERKRGLLNQWNEYLLSHQENPFIENTWEKLPKKPHIQYIITLDADTELPLNTGLELIGAMAHILNKPELNQEETRVQKGHALIQPRIGIHLQSARKSIFTQIFAGAGGTDAYTNAISDIYQDNFDEGIFTGKGIYDLSIFSKVLKNAIPENTVLSHDLLEGCYLRCGLATDIALMDGFPKNYNSFKNRMHRWIRGDFQITQWLKKKVKNAKGEMVKNPLPILCKYKIADNVIRENLALTVQVTILFFIILKNIASIVVWPYITIAVIAIIMPSLIEICDRIMNKQEGAEGKKSFTPSISPTKASIIRAILTLQELPDKAYTSTNAMVKTIYRKKISKKHFLEWTTSEEAEKLAKTDLFSYYQNMIPNIVLGIAGILGSILLPNCKVSMAIWGILWIMAPFTFWYIGKEKKKKNKIQEITEKEQEYLLDIGKRTWQFFKENITEENHYLMPDNYQEDRKEKLVQRTSSTNIGLELLAVITSYDMGYESLEDTLKTLKNIIDTIERLPKWNGHLYNWYNIKTLEPLIPRYISTVDSGNFIGYVYVLKAFYQEIQEKHPEYEAYIPFWTNQTIQEIPFAQADFSQLYDSQKRLMSIGFNVEENELTDSYYDLLASEARQTSLVAIAKKDVPAKHWYSLSRTLTTMNHYKGLLSWSGTAFEYLMPNINIHNYEGSLLDESCKFMLMSQKEYAKRIGIPWGFSETAFNIRDFQHNYQYKAIGIPWLGLKRGLENDYVVASYASALALMEEPKSALQNLKRLAQENMYQKYGFYESIDYTPSRLRRGEKSEVIKTYMAHHQALILLSINNLFHDNILQRRMNENPEIEAVDILLQERMPESMIITKEQKTKPEKIKYHDYEDYCVRVIPAKNIQIPTINVIANNEYTIIMNQKGEGYSKYKDIFLHRYKATSQKTQGIFFYMKNIKNKRIWTTNYSSYLSKPDKYEAIFAEDMNKIVRIDGNMETVMKNAIASETPVEIRNIELINQGLEEETIEVTAAFEPVLSTKEQDYAHPAFNQLFLRYEYLEEEKMILIQRRDRENAQKRVYLAVSFFSEQDNIGEVEYEMDREKFYGRGNLGIPEMVKDSKPFSKRVQLVTDPFLAMKRTVTIKPNEKKNLSLILSIAMTKQEAIDNAKEQLKASKIKSEFEIARARVEAENRYIGINAKQIAVYQKLLGYLIDTNPYKNISNGKENMNLSVERLWKYGISGDLPILFIKIKNANDLFVIDEVFKAYQFYRSKNIKIDVVICNEEKNSYENYVQEGIFSQLLNHDIVYMQNQKGGIFVLQNLSKEEKKFLECRANVTIYAQNGSIERNLKDLQEKEEIKEIGYEIAKIPYQEEQRELGVPQENLKYANEYGGFSEEGKEYQMKMHAENRLPTVWSHIMANEKWGTVLTENMGGYTWYRNSRLNRITAWSNDQVTDEPSEIIYLQDLDDLKTWSLGLNPMPDNQDYQVTYGWGYAFFSHKSHHIKQETTIFVPREDSVKIYHVVLKNELPKRKKLKMVYYIKPVLGEDESSTQGFIQSRWEKDANMILLKNLANTTFQHFVYISSSEKIRSFTGSLENFIGKGNLSNPEGIQRVAFNNENSLGKKSILAIEMLVELEAFENKEVNIVLGAEEEEIACKDKAYQYTNITNSMEELTKVKREYTQLLGKVEVKTPLESFNLIMNGWLMYQTLVSRLYARTGFYQSGGAYGFRDQLQDTIGLKYLDIQWMRKQILKHASHQFEEGDVEHWWHDDTSKGIRTRFSDDLLWLVYLVEEYIEFTGKEDILEEQVPYRKGKILEEGIDEKYDTYPLSENKGSIYEHCTKALERIELGENGIPKIGSGDWNDGFSKVGNQGKGESVWLGFFVYHILHRWIPILQQKEPEKIAKYQEMMEELKKALNTKCWDGRWYKRAFMDDGNVLGTLQNEECKIDGISQSWAVISNAGDNDKKYISLESLENHLVDRENGIIKLLDPPFNKSKLEPGYIKAYLPGTRENGGQYTHGAIWAIIAEAMLGFGDKALELFRMINPIEHARTKEAAKKYKVEPYVLAADIYGYGNLAGRGGWTWYTGSSSWMYEAGLHYILGLTIQKGYLSIQPTIPSYWKEYAIVYRYGSSIYHIKVQNPNGKCTGVEEFYCNQQAIEDKKIRLVDDGKVYEIQIKM